MALTDRDVLRDTNRGLYCPGGDFYIDPSRPVQRAVITHAHGDHARRGSSRYLTSKEGESVLAHRMDDGTTIMGIDYGEEVRIGDVTVSLHPAGHIRGAAQVRVERGGEVWVVTGDYKVTSDPTCTDFELVPCDVFITECTFGLPVYRWPEPARVFEEINEWWATNRKDGKASVLFGYSLGKAQRLLTGIDASAGPIYTHGAVEKMNDVFRRDGVDLPSTTYVSDENAPDSWAGALIVAPSSANGSRWLQRFGPLSTGFASGWMRIRGRRRQQSYDRGFILSDHVDWDRLNAVVQETGAERVYATHGYEEIFTRWLREHGVDAHVLALSRELGD